MGEAGHKVIVADADPTFGLNMTRFSKYVHSFHLLNNTKTYVEDLIAVFKAEKVSKTVPKASNKPENSTPKFTKNNE